MKKFTMFCAVAILLSALATGCTSTGGSSENCFTRIGSAFGTSRAKNRTETVYFQGGSQCDPCEPVSACSPCEPVACGPCEAICKPCDTVNCNGIMPGPYRQ